MATAAALSQTIELVGFLSTGGQTQVKLALEHTAALSGSEEGVAALLEAQAAKPLHKHCLSLDHTMASDAAATLANLCAASEPTCQQAADAEGLVDGLCLALGKTPSTADVTAVAALLANLSTQRAALGTLAKHADALTVRLVESEDEGTARLAHALVNAAQASLFGTILLRAEGELLMRLVDTQLAHADGVRRQGAAGVLRNLCLDEYNHVPICKLGRLIPAICVRLLPRDAEIDEEDSLKMAPLLREAVRASLESPLPGTLEPEPSIRLMLTECLLALTVTRLGREHLRRAHIYPVMRESHKREEDEAVIGQNEEIVSLLLADEGGAGAPAAAAMPPLLADEGGAGAPAAAATPAAETPAAATPAAATPAAATRDNSTEPEVAAAAAEDRGEAGGGEGKAE